MTLQGAQGVGWAPLPHLLNERGSNATEPEPVSLTVRRFTSRSKLPTSLSVSAMPPNPEPPFGSGDVTEQLGPGGGIVGPRSFQPKSLK